jgi:hypothetical protein
MRLALAAALWLGALPALAADRPSEDELFGAPAQEKSAEPKAEPQKAAEGADRPSESALFGAPEPAEKPAPAKAKEESPREVLPEDPLKIGGQFYMRAYSVTSAEAAPKDWAFTAPTLVDAYLDARPNERVRGFLLGCLAYDPTVPSNSASARSFYSAAQQLTLGLDQLWLRFDLERAIFFTVGRQHVKWGPSHFWNPTDFLHQVHLDPLAPFDARLGTTMVKAQIPWEKHGWNLYAIGLFEDLAPDGTLGKIGGGARAEVVLGLAEIGVEALFQRGHRPRLGADISTGLGPFDVYAEASLHKGWEQPLWRFTGGDPSLGVEPFSETNYTVQATGGLNWSLNYMDVNVLTFGAEYFYNSVGYSDSRIYPYLLSQSAFNAFYTGVHYLGVYGILAAPATWKNLNLVLSNVGNLSDTSFVARLDASIMILTHLRVEAYTAFHYGHRGGEMRFTTTIPKTDTSPAYTVPTPLCELGLGLRVSI